jgi:putative ATP-binding cassette transporter
MILLRFLFARARLRTIGGMVAGLGGGLAAVVALALIQPAVDNAGRSARPLTLFALASAASVLLNIVSEHLASVQAQDVLLRVRLDLARRVMATPLAQLEQLGAPPILTALTEDPNAVASALPGLAQLCPQVAIVVGCFGYMLWLAPWGFLVIAALMIVGLTVYTLPQRLGAQAIDAGRLEAEKLAAHLRALEGIKQVQTHRGRAEYLLHQRLAPTAASSRRHAVRAFGMFLVGTNLGRAFFLIAIFTVLLVGPRFGASSGTTVALALAVLYLTRPLEVILSWTPAISRAQVGLTRIEELGIALGEPAGSAITPPAARPCRVELVQCSYEYRSPSGDAFTVGPIDLVVEPGQVMFLTGGNGSGKTTLAKMLVGLYVPSGGEIRVNGQLVTDRHAYRQHFSAIFADSFPFDDLRLPNEAAEAAAVATRYDLARFQIEELIHRSAVSLSHGQRKRALLLSALIEDRPCYVFDEWAAEQDPAFREIFYAQLLPGLRAQGKAVVVITHDDQYFHLADRVLRLEYGQPSGRDGQRAPAALAAVSGAT